VQQRRPTTRETHHEHRSDDALVADRRVTLAVGDHAQPPRQDVDDLSVGGDLVRLREIRRGHRRGEAIQRGTEGRVLVVPEVGEAGLGHRLSQERLSVEVAVESCVPHERSNR
jgi:hypothetical protein